MKVPIVLGVKNRGAVAAQKGKCDFVTGSFRILTKAKTISFTKIGQLKEFEKVYSKMHITTH